MMWESGVVNGFWGGVEKSLGHKYFRFSLLFPLHWGLEELFMFISLWTFHVHLPWHLSCFQPF
jgi:hypothetical protein